MNQLTTEAALAEAFSLSPEKVADLRRRHYWPHVRLGRFDVRYTDEQVAVILDMESAEPHDPPRRFPGQTARSASRSRRRT